MPLKAVILIGGPQKGTRFRPLSFEVPKPLFPVAGVPMVQHHIEACAKVPGVKEILLMGFYQPHEALSRFLVSAQQEFKIPIRYLQEYAALGTGGGIYHFRDQILSGGAEAFFVLNADVCSEFPLQEMLEFRQQHGDAHSFVILGTTANRTQALNYGCIVANADTQEVQHYVEKPSTFVSEIINCGIYLFTPAIFQHIGEVFQRNQQELVLCPYLGPLRKAALFSAPLLASLRLPLSRSLLPTHPHSAQDKGLSEPITWECSAPPPALCTSQPVTCHLCHHPSKNPAVQGCITHIPACTGWGSCTINFWLRAYFSWQSPIPLLRWVSVGLGRPSLTAGAILTFGKKCMAREESSNGWQRAEVIRLEQDVFTALAGSGKLYVYKTDGFWSQIKSAGSAIYASRLYLNQYSKSHPERLAQNKPGGPIIRGNVYIHPTASIDSTAVLGPNVSIGEGVTVGAGVRVRESIVLHGASLHDHTCVLNTIVGWDSTIGRWARVEGTPSDPNPNDPYAKIDSETLFRDGRLTPSITILGCSVTIPAEVVILNSIVLPHKELSRSYKNQIIL
ncbi:mannose-1-phosphate guanylyltransferase regulatory subunit alpha isoform X1 [Athene noctua]|uniref:mannose-1-phosphate guanylyltransferase regulatory subunit alpha isoform X1 n=2 Tax=Telluraves TaxID=3073808 RepID=UPI003EC02031